MDKENENIDPSLDEQNADEEMTKEVQEDELREKLAEDLGLDPDDEDQQELLDRLTEREIENRKKLSVAIRQKAKYRTLAQSTLENPKVKPKDKENKETPDIGSLVDQKLQEALELRELKALGLPEAIETEVRELSNIRKITMREASELPYIKARRAEVEQEQKLVDATKKRSSRAGASYNESFDYSKPLDPKDFKTADGNIDVKAWQEARAKREQYKAQMRSSQLT